jgi:hypothetical protein
MARYKEERAGRLDDDVVVDLSELVEPLTDYRDISDMLTDEQERKLLDYVRAMTKMSYARISRRYDHWKDADRAHDVWVPADTTKFREKVVIADTRAIADTVLTYLMSALGGRNPMFQLEGMNRKSRKSAAILERLLHQHMRRTAGEARLAQLLLDSVRYGFAPAKVVWDPKTNTNQVVNFDPRRVFPDPRVTWGDWDRMQFVVFVDHVSTNALIGSGMYPKIRKYPGLRRGVAKSSSWDAHMVIREEGRGLNISPDLEVGTDSGFNFSLDDARLIDEAWVRLNGYEIGVPSIDQVWMVVTIMDEEAVIRCQLNPYGRQFPVVVGGLFHDVHKTYSQSLYDLLLPLHEVSTWLLRSRIDNVQAALNNLVFVDPTQVSVPDLIDRNPWGVVRTLPGTKPGEGVFIAQVPDVTKGHWDDIAAMSELKQRVSAGNLQDSLLEGGAIRLDPADTSARLEANTDDGYFDYKQAELQGDVDYLVIDGTLPIEPTRNAETWLSMLQVINQTGLQMEYKGGKIVEEAIRAMGISDLDRFKITEREAEQGMSPSQEMAVMEKMRGASVQPQEKIQAEAAKGNIIPMRQAMGLGE